MPRLPLAIRRRYERLKGMGMPPDTITMQLATAFQTDYRTLKKQLETHDAAFFAPLPLPAAEAAEENPPAAWMASLNAKLDAILANQALLATTLKDLRVDMDSMLSDRLAMDRPDIGLNHDVKRAVFDLLATVSQANPTRPPQTNASDPMLNARKARRGARPLAIDTPAEAERDDGTETGAQAAEPMEGSQAEIIADGTGTDRGMQIDAVPDVSNGDAGAIASKEVEPEVPVIGEIESLPAASPVPPLDEATPAVQEADPATAFAAGITEVCATIGADVPLMTGADRVGPPAGIASAGTDTAGAEEVRERSAPNPMDEAAPKPAVPVTKSGSKTSKTPAARRAVDLPLPKEKFTKTIVVPVAAVADAASPVATDAAHDGVAGTVFTQAIDQYRGNGDALKRAKAVTLQRLHDRGIGLEMSDLVAALVRQKLIDPQGNLLVHAKGDPVLDDRTGHGAAPTTSLMPPSPAKPAPVQGFTEDMFTYPDTRPARPAAFAAIDLDARYASASLAMEEARYLAELILFIDAARGRMSADRLMLTGGSPIAKMFHDLFGTDVAFKETLCSIGALAPGRGFAPTAAFVGRFNANHDLTDWARHMAGYHSDLRRSERGPSPDAPHRPGRCSTGGDPVALFLTTARAISKQDRGLSLEAIGLRATRSLIGNGHDRELLRAGLQQAGIIAPSGKLLTLTPDSA